jgi:hypothetical protein
LATMRAYLDSLDADDVEHCSVRVVIDDHWGIAAFASGLLILENTSIPNSEKHLRVDSGDVIRIWQLLVDGGIDAVVGEGWKPGYGVGDE